jgi:hypothetical protein
MILVNRRLASKKLSQSVLEAHLSGRASLRVEPALEILNPHLVLDLGVFDDHDDSGLTLAQISDPITLTECSEPLSDRFVKRVRSDFNCVFDSFEIAARDLASSKNHQAKGSRFAFISPTESHGLDGG